MFRCYATLTLHLSRKLFVIYIIAFCSAQLVQSQTALLLWMYSVCYFRLKPQKEKKKKKPLEIGDIVVCMIVIGLFRFNFALFLFDLLLKCDIVSVFQ